MTPHPRSASRLRRASALPLVATLLAVQGCGTRASGPPAGPPPVPVSVEKATREDVPVSLRAIGAVTERSAVSVRSRVEGEVREVHFREGREVRKGDLLFSIDPRPFQAAVHQIEADERRDRALAENAEADLRRYQDLVAKDFVTREEFDAMQARAASLRATVQADEAALEKASLELGYCEIRSPVDGRTGEVIVHAGNVVKANESVLVVIRQTRPIDVTFSVPEQVLPEIRKRLAEGALPVEALPRGGEGDSARGRLDFLNNQVDRDTGTIQLKASFDNADGVLWPGQFVEASLTLATLRDATVVPTRAVQTGQKGPFVYVVRPDRTVDLRPIVVQATFEEKTVVREGVEPGDLVVTDGQLRLTPGARAEVKSSRTAGSDTAP